MQHAVAILPGVQIWSVSELTDFRPGMSTIRIGNLSFDHLIFCSYSSAASDDRTSITMLRAEQDLRQRLVSARLPAIPEVLLRLLECCQDEDPDAAYLLDLLAMDPGMAASVLGMANGSAYRSTALAVVSLDHGLRVIGVDMLRTLVVNQALAFISSHTAQPEKMDLLSFWQHSMRSALAAREIALVIGYSDAEEAYLAGLFHDIGRLGLLAAFPAEYSRNFGIADADELGWTEQRTLEVNHLEAGFAIVESWQLDNMLADSILYHHEPVSRLGDAHPLIRIVQLAHLLAMSPVDEDKVSQAAAALKLSRTMLAELSLHVTSQLEDKTAMLGIATENGKKHVAAASMAVPTIGQRLSDELHNMILAANAGKVFARQGNAVALHDAIRRSARILFDFDDAVLFLRSRDGFALSGALAGERRQRLATMSIPLSSEGAIAQAAAACALVLIRRDETALGLPEEQLLNILNAECLVCLPVATRNGRLLGMLAGGVNYKMMPAVRQRERLLRVFAGQAAAALDHDASGRAVLHSQVVSLTEEYRAASQRMAHEVNNPLSIIKNYLTLLGDKLRRNQPIQSELSILHEEIDRVSGLVGGMAEIAPLSEHLHGDTAVAKVMREVVYLFKHTEFASPAINIMVTTRDPFAVIEGSADLLKQILVNLMKNAVEALDGAGEIEISDEGQVNRDGRLFLELAVRDTGPGIPAALQANLFAPLVSSKIGQTRGLGLSIVHGLVAKMHGMIMCRSNRRGTVFQILLPIPVSTPVSPAGEISTNVVSAP